MTDAALGATLEAFAGGEAREIPFWQMATLDQSDLTPRVEALAARIGGSVFVGESVIGAGSLPGVAIPTPQIALEGQDHLHGELLAAAQPILSRRQGSDLVIDIRAVVPEDDDVIADMVAMCR
jgi:hypothetical protein